MRTVLYIILVVVVLALVGAGAYILLGTGGDEAAQGATVSITEPEEINARALAYVQPPYNDDYGMLRLAGYVDNNSDQTIAQANLEFQLLDEDGNKKELIAYQVKNIPPQSRKTFDANAGNLPADRKVELSIVELQVVE